MYKRIIRIQFRLTLHEPKAVFTLVESDIVQTGKIAMRPSDPVKAKTASMDFSSCWLV